MVSQVVLIEVMVLSCVIVGVFLVAVRMLHLGVVSSSSAVRMLLLAVLVFGRARRAVPAVDVDVVLEFAVDQAVPKLQED